MKKTLFLLGLFSVCITLIVGLEWVMYKRVSDKECLPLVKSLLATGENLGDGMVYNYEKPYIARNTSLILSKYYIKGYGKVPRNSVMDELIEHWIDSADAADLKKYVQDTTKGTVLYTTKDSAVQIITAPPINYDSLCVVGKRYILYPPDYGTDNPFEQPNAAHVTIVNKKNGYVQYSYTNQLKSNPTRFNRSCKDFIDLTKIPTKP